MNRRILKGFLEVLVLWACPALMDNVFQQLYTRIWQLHCYWVHSKAPGTHTIKRYEEVVYIFLNRLREH